MQCFLGKYGRKMTENENLAAAVFLQNVWRKKCREYVKYYPPYSTRFFRPKLEDNSSHVFVKFLAGTRREYAANFRVVFSHFPLIEMRALFQKYAVCFQCHVFSTVSSREHGTIIGNLCAMLHWYKRHQKWRKLLNNSSNVRC